MVTGLGNKMSKSCVEKLVVTLKPVTLFKDNVGVKLPSIAGLRLAGDKGSGGSITGLTGALIVGLGPGLRVGEECDIILEEGSLNRRGMGVGGISALQFAIGDLSAGV